MKKLLTLLLMALNTISFAQKTDSTKTVTIPNKAVGPHVILYKTKANYAKWVPITLSTDKQKVVAYPSPKDVYHNGNLAYPYKMDKDFLLDNRGIGLNSAFIKICYADYAKLDIVPLLPELLKMVIDNDPFTEMYDLGLRSDYKNVVKEVNAIINANGLGKYKRLK